MPLSSALQAAITARRRQLQAALGGDDPRLVVVVGPCSVHDPEAAVAYAARLAALAPQLEDALLLVMRTYFEKPRSTVGWKGLLNDPHLDGSFAIADGLQICRRLLRRIGALGVATACEFLDPLSAAYLAAAVCWGAIGARTAESQTHRELASGLCMPVGFKNGTDGNVAVAVQGMLAAAQSHHSLGIDADGRAAQLRTSGNPACHLVLRGGTGGPNFAATDVAAALARLQAAGLQPAVMVDVSHGNSGKCLRKQRQAAAAVAAQVAAGNRQIVGVMMESFLVDGAQPFAVGASLTYGQSITDPCLGWEQTVAALHQLAAAVRQRSAP